tara:strand:+ start:260 stop:385 length:126 start_codon:yes stop_codon:yes gene_type:complete
MVNGEQDQKQNKNSTFSFFHNFKFQIIKPALKTGAFKSSNS